MNVNELIKKLKGCGKEDVNLEDVSVMLGYWAVAGWNDEDITCRIEDDGVAYTQDDVDIIRAKLVFGRGGAFYGCAEADDAIIDVVLEHFYDKEEGEETYENRARNEVGDDPWRDVPCFGDKEEAQ